MTKTQLPKDQNVQNELGRVRRRDKSHCLITNNKNGEEVVKLNRGESSSVESTPEWWGVGVFQVCSQEMGLVLRLDPCGPLPGS